jgi:DNA-binding NarL/FixJ family response regulator
MSAGRGQIKADPALLIIPVVIMSSSGYPGDIRRSYELHANAYVVIPAEFGDFDDVIRTIGAFFLGLIESPPPA